MKSINELKPSGIRGMSYNVYSVYSFRDHKMLCTRRIMCNPFIGTDRTRFSNPHQLSWSQFKAKKEPQEPFFDTVIGGLAFAALCVALAFV